MNKLKEYDAILAELDALTPEAMAALGGITSWQSSGNDARVVDSDGFGVDDTNGSMDMNFQALQAQCWKKFVENPFASTSIPDSVSRLVGKGFEMASPESKIEEKIEEIWEDPRNNLIIMFKKYLVRAEVQGELYLSCTVHTDGFVEVDRIAPGSINGFKDGTGILSHPNKSHIPLMYRISVKSENGSEEVKFIPSIHLAYYKDMWKHVKTSTGYDPKKLLGKAVGKKYAKLKNCKTFMVKFDKGWCTKRNVGQVKTVLAWLQKYEDIKKWEYDHKKSSGAYLWTIEIEDQKAFRGWIAMSAEDKAKTGLMAKKTPGGTLMLPPGFKINCHNPKLTSITNQDNDILQLISAGLNTAEDMMTGSSSGTTFSGIKMSRGPISDRTSDQIIDLDRFLKYEFWRAVFFLANVVTGFKVDYKVKRAYEFNSKGEPKFKNFKVAAHKLIEIEYPASEIGNVEDKAKAFLGVKHGAVTDALGLSAEEIAGKLGFTSYRKSRLKNATEQEMYPELKTSEEIESEQAVNGEKGLEDKVVKPKEGEDE